MMFVRRFLLACLGCIAIVLGVTVANGALAAETVGNSGRRVALVIGNGDYQHIENLPKLDNPAHDAEDIANALRGFGFEVIERKNQTLEAMNAAIAEFGRRIGESDAALFYFAGHGIQVKNQNFLMPVNAKIDSEASVPYQGVNINQVLDEMDNAKSAANIVMLDACRNNPVTGKYRSGKTRGLAPVANTPKGTVIVYATDPGNVAEDGDGRNGVFTGGLLAAFKGKDLSLDEVLTVASAEVERATGNKQTPYVNGPKTLQKNFNFRVTVDPGKAEIEKTFWTSIERSSIPADFDAYLRKYPNGSYRALAENRLKQFKSTEKLAAGKPGVPAAGNLIPPTPGKLYVLAIGISKYPEPFTLLPNKDARDFSNHFGRNHRNLYSSMPSRLLIDEQATRENILNGMDWLRDSVGENDTGVIFVAGFANLVRGDYWFIPSDVSAFPAEGSVKSAAERQRWEEANASARWVPASAFIRTIQSSRGRMLAFFDTSNSGRLVQQISKEPGKTAPKSKQNFMLMTSSAADEESQEDEASGNGAFTKVLLEGLRGASVKSSDGFIRPSDLAEYVANGVKALTSGVQNPQSHVVGSNDPIASK
jgi:uncharacterized caspase-like protein